MLPILDFLYEIPLYQCFPTCSKLSKYQVNIIQKPSSEMKETESTKSEDFFITISLPDSCFCGGIVC